VSTGRLLQMLTTRSFSKMKNICQQRFHCIIYYTMLFIVQALCRYGSAPW